MLLRWGVKTNETSTDVSSVSPSSERIRGHNTDDDNNIHVIGNSTVSHLPFYPPLKLPRRRGISGERAKGVKSLKGVEEKGTLRCLSATKGQIIILSGAVTMDLRAS